MLKKSVGLIVIFCLNLLFVFAQANKTDNIKISINFENEELSRAILQIQSKTHLNFSFDPDIIPSRIIKVNFVETPFKQVLDNILDGTGIDFQVSGNQVILTRHKKQTVTINGHLTDASSGEDIIGANILIRELKTTISTNQYGYYSFTVPEGIYHLQITHISYLVREMEFSANASRSESIQLSPSENRLLETVVGIRSKDSLGTLNSLKNLAPAELKGLPYFAGELDVVKALQMQPGIKAMTESSSGLFVRGGNIDQNLIMLDEAMIYNPSHLFGLVSVFNPDAIKNVQYYTDYMPANYGGRLSSVVDGRMAEGNNHEFQLKGGVSPLSVRIAAEGPIKKETGSYLITFRRSIIDLLNQNFGLVNPNSSYYDINAKANYRINDNNRLLYSFYLGDDHIYSKNSYVNNWGNLTSTLRWNHIFSNRLFLNLSAIYSNYRNKLDINADTLSEKGLWQTGIRDAGLKADFTFYGNLNTEVKFGVQGTYHQFKPGQSSGTFFSDYDIPDDHSQEYALYFSHQFKPTERLQLSYGFRATAFKNGEQAKNLFNEEGNEIIKRNYKTYWGIEPRFHIGYQVARHHNIFASYNHTRQYLQLIQNSELAFSSLETWMPASGSTKPQISDFISSGYRYSDNRINFSASAYYKNMRNQLEMSEHTQVILNPDIRSHLKTGESQAWGAEFSASQTAENFRGTLSYVYSRVFRQFDGVNGNIRFPANYDFPNTVKLTLSYFLTDKISLNSFFIYSDGRPATLPIGYYMQDGIQVPIFEGRNASRFPDYNRLDLSAQWLLSGKSRFKSTLSVGVNNVYNRKNPLFYSVRQASPASNFGLVQTSTGIIPWITYGFQI
ncbi:TonB-dependent receptor [Pedobacter sp. HMF7647]|uniref:TonB-dependent receptor n=1 Tax=Hufsiella arboris TaxID=2695275 RepID=A0A7K1YAI2_9SPHI|nr:TonB-dependent receptor [Hufsiella arboris]MXV51584.1 TonB-dependent receptor [Hufsiella arboris]